MKTAFTFLALFFFALNAESQCTTLGQTPSTAFPVCGVDTFTQLTVPICFNNYVPAASCGSYEDNNPFWYQFTCFKSGTLGFLIIPDSPNQDYDWELFDITGHSASDVYTDSSLFVVANWCGSYGPTGTSDTATDLIECASLPTDGVSTFSIMPSLIQGHIYLLLVSHYTSDQSGYKLTFSGGTSEITQPGTPSLKSATLLCGDTIITIKLSKQVKCSSLASDGSDFTISNSSSSIASIVGINCDSSFDFDSVVLQLSAPLPAGNYLLSVKIGTDSNTLLDDCNNSIAVGDSSNLIVLPTITGQFTYQIFYGCKYDSVQFINLSNGQPKWQWTLDSAIHSSLQNPLIIDSVYGMNTVQLTVSNGQCYDTSSATFVLDNQLKSGFSAPAIICPTDTASLQNNSIGNVTSWYWDFGDGTNSTDSAPIAHIYPSTLHDMNYLVKLIIGNEVGCHDTSVHQITRLQSCYINVPSAFTPNGDGINDYLFPLNAFKATNLQFKVYNRYGQEVFETKDWTKKWDGTINGKPQATGAYVWMLQYTDGDTGKSFFLKGTTLLIR